MRKLTSILCLTLFVLSGSVTTGVGDQLRWGTSDGPWRNTTCDTRTGANCSPFEEAEHLAKQGFAKSQYLLGEMFEKGRGIPQNNKMALKWYTLAAEQGHANAGYKLGLMYEYGRGVPQNNRIALRWHTAAAEQGHADAQSVLAVMYATGQGVPQNYKTALRWYILAAEQGVAVARIEAAAIQRKFEEARLAEAAERELLPESARKKAEAEQRGIAREQARQLATAAKNRLAVLALKKAEARRRQIAFGDYYALVIGNNDYVHLPKLTNAAGDAKDISSVLRNLYDFEVQTLLNASRSEIFSALVKLRSELTWESNLLIFYAGHGIIDEYTGRGFWQPVNAAKEDPANWISNADITNMLSAIRAKHVMIIADSCYSGTLVRSTGKGLRTAKDRDVWLNRISQKRSRTALVSGGIEPVMDGGGGKNSVFSRALLDVLKENQDVIDGTTVFESLKRRVVLGSDQTPEYSDIRKAEHDGGDFLLVRRRAIADKPSLSDSADPLEKFKNKCAALGFIKGSEKHGDCVMKLFK